MGAKPRGVGPRVGRARIPVRVPGAPPSPPRQECGRAAAWQPRGPPPRREETATRLSRGSRASQAMTIFQPLAPAGQVLSLRSRPGSRGWPRRLDGRVAAATSSAGESPGRAAGGPGQGEVRARGNSPGLQGSPPHRTPASLLPERAPRRRPPSLRAPSGWG